MTHRERAITAITGGTPDYVPTFELVFHETERDLEGRTFFGTSFEPKARGMSYTDIVKYNARLYVDVARRYDHSIIFVNSTLRDHEPPGEHQDRFTHCTPGTLDTIKAIRDLTGDEFLVVNHNDPTFPIPWEEMEKFCYSLFEDPEGVHRTARQALDDAMRECEAFLAAGSDGFVLASDYCTNDGPFISPPSSRSSSPPT